MRKPSILAAAALLAGLAAAPALAQNGPGPGRNAEAPRGGPVRLFGEADADRDGRVTEAEGWNWLSTRFAAADTDGNGGLSRDELRAAWARGAGRPVPPRAESRADAMFRAADADRDGRVSLAEIRPMAEAMFRAADRDGDGALSRDEVMPRRGERPRGAERAAEPAR